MSYYEILKEVPPPKIKRDRRIKDTPKKAATNRGEVRFLGTICKRNHSGWRYTKGGQCIECVELGRNVNFKPRQRSSKNHARSLEAANSGNVTYIPDKACKRNHFLRYINSNNCVECDKIMILKHKISIKFKRIEKIYGLSKEKYLAMVLSQKNCCAICDNYFEDHFQLHVDHCHDTNVVRGLLCPKCNQGIGLLNHNPELIRKSAVYCEQI